MKMATESEVSLEPRLDDHPVPRSAWVARRASNPNSPPQDSRQRKRDEEKSKGRGVELLSFFRLTRAKTYPIGVLPEFAPLPLTFTRITPD